MVRSRLRVSNGIVTLAVDTATGKLLELTDCRSGDNLIKNHLPSARQPFCLYAGGRALCPAGPDEARREPGLAPEIGVEERADGARVLRVRYERLWAGEGCAEVSARYEAELAPGSCETKWRLALENRAGLLIERVCFPSIHGVYLGDTWKDDTLAYPYLSGELIRNPVETYAADPVVMGWKWQEYDYRYLAGGIYRRREPDGSYVREGSYSGPLSMLWMDCFDAGGGLYMACHDTGGRVSSLRAETFGPARPGMGLSIVHHPFLERGGWQSPECSVALHPGDWHWAADRYREAHAGFSAKRAAPEWFLKSPGLVAHYDFKYQGGGVVHRFRDIPALYDRALGMGFDHLLLSGWHRDGFDCGFPKYRCDPELGGEEELAGAVRFVRGRGGHVSFYVNSRLFNAGYEELGPQRDRFGVMNRDGSIFKEQYGDRAITFATMCPGSEGWLGMISDALSWLGDTIGADGVYLDTLAMAPPLFCFNAAHGHGPADWNAGNRRLIARAFESMTHPAVLYEGASDLHGPGAAGQLVSSFAHYHVGAAPELYKYTFPDQILVDMLYPRRGQAMRPVHAMQKSREMMDKAFVIGSYYWVYDLAEDNSFDNDAELKHHLMGMAALRRAWLERFGHGRFRDAEGISAPPGLLAKRFSLGERGELLAVANPSRREGGIVEMDAPEGGRYDTNAYTIDAPGSPLAGGAEAGGGRVGVPVPPAALSVIHVRRARPGG